MNELFRIEGLNVSIPHGHLWKRSWKRVLHGIGFSIQQGESVAYLGPNGAGKTTTFRAICGLSTRFNGNIFWKKQNIALNRLHTHIGFMPEQPYFYRTLSSRELLDSLARLSGVSSPDRSEHIRQFAEELDFTDILDQPLHTCSKGQIQRVGLAQAMLHKPEMLILDEPMSGLDPIGRELVASSLKKAVSNGTTLLFSSHILDDAENLCDRVIALNRGEIIFDGSLDKLTRGHGWEMVVELDDHSDFLPPLSVEPMLENRIRIHCSESDYPVQQVIEKCLARNGEIISIFQRQERLEDAFVKLLRSTDD